MEGTKKPNIIYIMMDDMGYGDVGCYGNETMNTPVMDELALDGMRFTQMYSAPICSPARAQLLTGMYAQRIGIPRVLFPDDANGLKSTYKTIGSYLGESGYKTSCIGKWHLGCRDEHFPTRHGFNHFYGLLYSNDMDPLYLYRDESVVEEEVDQSSLTEKYTTEAISFISENKDEPFFLYLAHTMPHIPLHVPEEFRGKSLCGTYGDTIECIDYYIGRIVNQLRELGIEDNTLFIVTSDNGPWFEGSTGGLRGRKFGVYEGGVRMPFIAKWPDKIKKNSECNEMAHFMDMLPTFVSIAGGEISEDLDGKNISHLLHGEGNTPHEALYFYVLDQLDAIRWGKWKLHVAEGLRNSRSDKEMPRLFNLEIDPFENYNLADRYPAIVDQLVTMIDDFDQKLQPILNTSRL